MGHEQPKTGLAAKLLEHGNGLTPPGHKPNPEPPQHRLEVAETFLLKRRVAGVPFRLLEHLGLVDEQGEHGSTPRAFHCGGKCRMVVHAQVSL